MGLLSFLKRKSGDTAAKPAARSESADTVQQARIRARQRLVGSVVLVAAGVIGFPLLFETQPRPLPGDTPIEVARRDSPTPAAPSARTPARQAAQPSQDVITETPGDAGREVAAPPQPAEPEAKPEPKPEPAKPAEPRPAATVEAKPAPKPEPRPEPKPEPKPAPKPEPKGAADSARAQALLEGRATAAARAAGDGRFIVQVGAYAEATAAREARQKVEKLGLKTYTQEVETSNGKRIRVRVGPFASRDEAEKASARIKSAGLSSAVFTL